jgi:multiple sugar transport system permease protein
MAPGDSGSAQEKALAVTLRVRAGRRLADYLQQEHVLGYLLLLPAFLWLAGLVAYPFGMAISYCLSNIVVGREQDAKFIGLDNFISLLHNELFIQTVKNSLTFTFSAVTLKAVFGLLLALLLNKDLQFKRLIRGCVLLPWVMPVALSALGWKWMYDSLYSVITWTLNRFVLLFGLAPLEINWLGQPKLAMASVIAVNTWIGLPFFAITLLAGLQGIPEELYEAAEVDGATPWHKFFHVTLPMLRPVLAIVILFSTIFTFADFNTVYILTQGGPMNYTHLFATLANMLAFQTLDLGRGAAVSLFMFPLLMILVFFILRVARREY